MEVRENSATDPGNLRPQTNPQPNPFGNKLYGASSGLIRSGLGAYGERIFGSSSEYVQSNVSTYLSIVVICQQIFIYDISLTY